uniref:Plasma membrane proteolipid 3 n=1 Tax=Panagrellus redivivus TaxID=6233 RepID=A0A7E4WAX9_PANRE
MAFLFVPARTDLRTVSASSLLPAILIAATIRSVPLPSLLLSLLLRSADSPSTKHPAMCECLLLLCAILFPPIAVLIRTGCSVHFLINIFLWILGIVPGIIHAIYVCFYAQGVRI